MTIMGEDEIWRELRKLKPSEQVFYQEVPAAPHGLGSRVGEWLWVGDWQQASDFMKWTRKQMPYRDGVARVVTCAFDSPIKGDYSFNIVDGPAPGNDVEFWKAVDEILYLRGLSPRPLTFVHCVSGISRAPSVVMGAMMKARSVGYDQALGEMRSVRPVVNPHPYFVQLLRSYEARRVARPVTMPNAYERGTPDLDLLWKRTVSRGQYDARLGGL